LTGKKEKSKYSVVYSGIKEDAPYGRNKPARKELSSEPSNYVKTDPRPCSRKS